MAELKPGDEAYEIPDNPVYDPVIRKLKRSDPAEADSIFNPLFLQTICNTHAVRALAQEAKDAADAAQEAITEFTHTIDTVPSQRGTLTYSGSEQSPSWNGYASNALTAGGTTKATNAGTYSAVFTPKTGFKWSDGTADAKTVAWTIGRAYVSVPAQSGSLVYTGVSQSPVWTNYDANKLTLGGAASGTNAGSYNATFTPKANYRFSDGSTSAKTVAWTISKAAGSLSISPASLSFTATDSKTIAVTRAGNGAITVTSSNTGVATVSVSGTTVTVAAKKDGNATITIKVAEGTNHTAPSNKTCAATVAILKIFSASWDGTSTTKWTRTDAAAGFTDPVPYVQGASNYGSPFDGLQPWVGMVKSERTGGTMVAIPKFWYKLTQNGAGMKVQISPQAVSGFSVSPAHMDRGDGKGERDVVYIGRYHCGSSAYKSASGQSPKNNITRSAARTAIHNLGANIWQSDFAMRFTLWLLYIVEFADWNSQAKIGYGCGNNSGVQAMGYTDSMPYHTGTTQNSRTAYGLGTQYRNIEGLWCNVYDWCDGCYNNSNGFNIILNPNNFSDSANGVSVGTPCLGWPAAFTVSSTGGFPMFYGSASGGSESTYSCDSWYFNKSIPCVCVGGNYGQEPNRGLFYISYSSATSPVNSIGCRLQELP